MDQNANMIKWELNNPVKFMDKECGQVEVIASGSFAYEIINQETFSAAATQANMDLGTYAKGLLLSMVIEEINKFSGKMALSLSGIVKGDAILTNGNNKVAAVGLKFTSVVIEKIDLTEMSKNKMKDIETSKIKAAITGREIVNNQAPTETSTAEVPVDNNEVGTVTEVGTLDGEKISGKSNGVFGILVLAIIGAIIMMFFFK